MRGQALRRATHVSLAIARTPTSHQITVNGLRLHYPEAGEGDPVLLIHGFPASSQVQEDEPERVGQLIGEFLNRA